MTDVSFTPTFHHVAWVDNRDRVQAGGPNGFNTRFGSIEADLLTMSGVVTVIATALDTLGQRPPPVPKKLTLAPMMVQLDPPGWSQDSRGNAFRPQGQTGVSGLMTVPVPDGVLLGSLRVLGQNSGTGTLSIGLFRSPLAGSSTPPDRLARVLGDTNPFDATVAVDASMARVDMGRFRYFVNATCANTAAPDIVLISAIQIVYTVD